MAFSDVDYERCNLCRRSFQKGKNHIYSAKHIQSVRHILTKFSTKVEYCKHLVHVVFNVAF